ncbi:hypothetical protein MBM_00621 [Drepanopeziza brunnea f. sp. 'multigermtubi' MB_m1]|uniref:Uncharacterized protein n=1 Tax=Marssonina brunnea f. sp. multigermtubi (strain MB_m1) TaxID=1072389 RepID=K1XLS1_MARBU|nr:uncharacterized protein MBM_00621 [Drepanopeziza brunnea f. sp. 'multigermtubi' MB_m1]EKD21508.1 hypothetical protein MBM_00621 [Drepanopeziza brunnea f. sp. 'multigermtubi' MB_m1]
MIHEAESEPPPGKIMAMIPKESALWLRKNIGRTPAGAGGKPLNDLETTSLPIKTAADLQQAIREDDLGVESLSLYEELFPEEALAREKREKKALENLEKLPAFNWTSDFRRGAEYEREQARERERRRAALTSIPARPVAEDRTLLKGSARKPIQPESWKRDISGTKRYAVLVLSSCSTSLEESDFYRVTAQGEHVEDWTRGIVKVIPARDNMTLEPLGKYYLVFSSLAAASDYLSRTLDLKEFAGYDDFTRHHRARRMGEDQDMMIQSFSLVPADGQLSLKMLVPPFSKGVKWMLEAGGPAPLVGRQTKAQDIVLFTTDGRGGFIDKSTLTRALADDGLRRNLHWRFAGDREEAVVRLETNLLKEEAAERRKVTYKGAARYTIAFKDSNEARRFVREWHRRPFPLTTLGRLKEHTGDEPLPTVHAEICW